MHFDFSGFIFITCKELCIRFHCFFTPLSDLSLHTCIFVIAVSAVDAAVTLRCLNMRGFKDERRQISPVVIKIAPKYPSRLLNRAALWLAERRSRVGVQSVAVPCLEPALSGACLPTASAAALSGSYYTHWQLREAPFSSYFPGLFFTMGDKKSPTR